MILIILIVLMSLVSNLFILGYLHSYNITSYKTLIETKIRKNNILNYITVTK